MTADDFVKIIRSGSEKLRVDKIVINTGLQELHGKGMLKITREEIEIEVVIDEGDKVPKMKFGVFTPRDNWKVSGLIEDSLEFKCEHASQPTNTQWSWPSTNPSGTTRCTFDLHPINLIPSGWDAATREQRKDFLKQNQMPPTGYGVDKTEDSVCFYATLFEYPLHTSSWGDEIKGDTENFDFTIKKLEGSSDLRVSLESRKEYTSQGEKKDWQKFHAFMNALAFVTGTNAWPYRVEYWRAGQKLIDRVTAADKLSRTIHAPFPKQLAFNARTGSIKWNFSETVRLIAKFFETESALTEEVAYLLFLFRQAGSKGVHRDITVTALCVLFENLVRHIFKELKLEVAAREKNPLLVSFEQAKIKVVGQMDQQLIESDSAYKRVHDVIKSAEVFNAKLMFQTIVSHFGLKWEHDMELVFKVWQNVRHPSVHHSKYAARTEDDWKEVNLAESRIAGAINILALKLFSYSGYIRHSAFEDGYRQI